MRWRKRSTIKTEIRFSGDADKAAAHIARVRESFGLKSPEEVEAMTEPERAAYARHVRRMFI